jgi:hypothetical protein
MNPAGQCVSPPPPCGSGTATGATGDCPSSTPPAPSIAIVKVEKIAGTKSGYVHGPVTGKVGQTVDYRIIVKNTGKTRVTVTLHDTRCVGVKALGAQTIDPGASVVYVCTHKLTAADGKRYVNTASATGVDANGKTASAGPASVVARVEPAAIHVKAVHVTRKAPKPVKKKAKPAKPAVLPASFTG